MSRKTLVGVEITQESVRAAEVTVGAFPTLVAFGEVPLPPGAAADSLVRDRDAVSLALAHLWESARIGGRRVVLGVGGRRILVREVSLPTDARHDLATVLPPHVKEQLPVPAERAAMDFYPITERDGSTQGLLVAAPGDVIERMLASFSQTRARVRSVDLMPFGLARIAGRLGNAGEATMMIHIGDHTTHVVIAVGGVPRLVRAIPAEMLTSAVVRRASAEGFDPEPAVAVVTDRGGRAGLRIGASVLRSGPELAAEPADIVADLAHRLREIVAEYRARTGTTRVGAVFVSGAGSLSPGVEATVSAVLKRPLRRVALEQIVSTRGVQPDGESALDLVSTIGVVVGGPA